MEQNFYLVHEKLRAGWKENLKNLNEHALLLGTSEYAKKNDLQLKAKLLLWNRKRYARQDKLVSFHDYHDSFFFTSYLQAVISWLLYFFLFDGIKNCDVIDPLNINVNTKIHSCFFRTPCITKNIRYLIKILNIPCHQKS